MMDSHWNGCRSLEAINTAFDKLPRDRSAMRSWREAEQMSVLRAAVRILMRQPGGGSLVLYSSVAAPCDGIETLDQYT